MPERTTRRALGRVRWIAEVGVPDGVAEAVGLLGWRPVPGSYFPCFGLAASLLHLPGFLCHLPGVIALSGWQENPRPGSAGKRKAKAAVEGIPRPQVRQVRAAPASRCLPRCLPCSLPRCLL